MGTSLNHPLISVLVIAYNSAKTIIETLDSIKKQTYPELELIVTDDCSSDNTIFITKKWIENNHGRFIRVKLVTSAQNTGISANYNRGEDECSGEWITEAETIRAQDREVPCGSETHSYPDQTDLHILENHLA